MPTIDQWRLAWQTLGVANPDVALFHDLIGRYSEPRRAYHNTRHLDECLAQLPAVRSEATHPEEIELALWFHDAVYEMEAHDNEARSAGLVRAACLEAGLSPEVADRVHALVLATRHDAAPRDADARIIADIDLSILGAAPNRFDEYEHQIRQEYAWVPAQFFRRERRKILEGILVRPRIYGTEYFLKTSEARARENLWRSIKRLGG